VSHDTTVERVDDVQLAKATVGDPDRFTVGGEEALVRGPPDAGLGHHGVVHGPQHRDGVGGRGDDIEVAAVTGEAEAVDVDVT